MHNLQFKIVGNKYVIWSFVYDWESCDECSSYVEFQIGERCLCKKQSMWLIQCRHELCVDGRFDIEKHHHRWLNNISYQEKVGTSILSIANNSDDDNGNDIDVNSQVVTQNVYVNRDIQMSNSFDSNDSGLKHTRETVSYQSLLGQCEVLLRLIQHDKTKMSQFADNLTSCIERARKNYQPKFLLTHQM